MKNIKWCIKLDWLCMLKIIMWVMTALSICAIALTLFQDCFPCPFCFTSKGMANFLSMFEPFYPLFSGTILILTIYVALLTYTHSKKVDAIKALQDLRNMLMQGDNVRIHDLLEFDEFDKQQKQNNFELEFRMRQGTVYNYMGILELSKFYLDEGIISKEQFIDQFGYRVENLYTNPIISKWIKESPNCWETLEALKKIVDNR